MALPRKYRLRKKKEIELVKKKGKLISTPFFGLLVLKREKKPTQFAFLVSRRVSSRAVARNRIRRILSEGVRLNLARVVPGFRVVFLARKKILTEETQIVFRKIEEVLTKIGVITPLLKEK